MTGEDTAELPEPPRIVLPSESGMDKYDIPELTPEEKELISSEPEIK